MKTIFRFIVRRKLLFLIVPLLVVVTRRANRRDNKIWSKNKNVVTVLAIHPERFRGDLQILGQTGCVRVLEFPVYWQWQLVEAFVPKNQLASTMVTLDWYRRSHESDFTLPTLKLQDFLTRFLEKLYSALKVDAVITPNIRYMCDLDWLFVTQKLGVPSVVLFRESLLVSQWDYSGVVDRHKKFGKLLTDHVIAHNQIVANTFIDSGIATKSEISVCGNLRMDKFQQRIEDSSLANRKIAALKVVLFYFGPQSNRYGSEEYSKLVEETISAFLLLAKARSDVEFVLKPKREQLGIGRYQLLESDPYRVLERIDPTYRELSNFSVQPDIDVHNLLLSSTVVCGFYSTVLFEAALARKPVVLPFFDYFRESPFSKHYPLVDHLDLFDVALSKEQFISTILKYLEWPPEVPIFDDLFHKKRRKTFEKYISPIDGDVCRRTIDAIIGLVESKPGN